LKKILHDEDPVSLVFLCFLAVALFVLPLLRVFPEIDAVISEVYNMLIQTGIFGSATFLLILLSGYLISLLLIPKAVTSEKLWLSIGFGLGAILMTTLLISIFQFIFQIGSKISYHSAIVIFIALCLAIIPKKGK